MSLIQRVQSGRKAQSPSAETAALRRKFKKRGAFDNYSRYARMGGPAVVLRRGPDQRQLHPAWSRLHHVESGYTVDVQRIGKGHASEAFLGNDGWVYIFTNERARDPAKEVLFFALSRLGPRASARRHLPYIEWVGYGSTTRRKGEVWRMPKYEKASGAAAKQGRLLAKCMEDAWYKVLASPTKELDAVADFLSCAGKLVREKKLPPALLRALHALQDEMGYYGAGWLFEFPRRNLMQDDEGRLILLDVIFDRAALLANGW